MGQGPSKTPSGTTEHVFRSDAPVHFSPDLINNLQASPESDTTRALDQEREIQKRVHEELTRLSESASATLNEVSERISSTSDGNTESESAPATDSSSAAGEPDQAAKGKTDGIRDLGRASVVREIELLKERLKGRRLTEGVVGDMSEVRTVKDRLVKCLRDNDRRPLDCWEEVEQFKREVARLEKGFLGKVME